MIISKNYPFCPRKNLAPISAAAGATIQPTKTSQRGTACLSLVCTLYQTTCDTNKVLALLIIESSLSDLIRFVF